MQQLTPEGQNKINEIAQRYNVSTDAVMTLLQAVSNGNGTMAQFNHPELGGGGQWMSGGMTMVGDMFNNGLKGTVDGICTELSNLLAAQPFVPAPTSSQSQNQGGQQQQQGGYGYGYTGSNTNNSNAVSLFVPPSASNWGNWWPFELGVPTTSGAQNNIRYAYFANQRRLATDLNGRVSVYDTLDHQIGGVSQQQGGGSSVTFTSQYGTVDVLNLPLISGGADMVPAKTSMPPPTSVNPPKTDNWQQETNAYSAPPPISSAGSVQKAEIFATIEQLEQLRQKNILTEGEFVAKKTDLLNRL